MFVHNIDSTEVSPSVYYCGQAPEGEASQGRRDGLHARSPGSTERGFEPCPSRSSESSDHCGKSGVGFGGLLPEPLGNATKVPPSRDAWESTGGDYTGSSPADHLVGASVVPEDAMDVGALTPFLWAFEILYSIAHDMVSIKKDFIA